MENIFYQKIKNISRNILNSSDVQSISLELDSLYEHLKANFKEMEYFKKFEELINVITNENVIKNKNYTNQFLKKYLNIFFKEIKTDIFSSWGILLNKVLSRKNGINYPLIYSAIFKIYFENFEIPNQMNELDFPIADDIDLYENILKISEKVFSLTENSTSYDLIFYPALRNKIILFLYEIYKKNSKLNIFFCGAGIGIEPLIFSYTLSLINEVDSKNEKMKNLKITASDNDVKLLQNGIQSGYLNDLILKIKTDFAEENLLKEKELKTNLIDSKKNISVIENDFLGTGKLPDEDIEVIIISSYKYSDINFFKDKLIKRFRNISVLNKDFLIIIQVRSAEKIELENFILDNFKPDKSFTEIFSSKNDVDYFMDFLVYKISKTGDALEEKKNRTSLTYYVNNYMNYDKKDLKKMILMIDKKTIKTKLDNLNYSFILAKGELFTKSFDILKYNFDADFNLAFRILKEIIGCCKNEKIRTKAENFIMENQIKEMGFAADLLDAIEDGIDEYEIENKRSKWL